MPWPKLKEQSTYRRGAGGGLADRPRRGILLIVFLFRTIGKADEIFNCSLVFFATLILF